MSQPSRRKRSSNDPKNDSPASKNPDVKAKKINKWSGLEVAAVHSFFSRGAPDATISLLLQIKCQTSYRRTTQTIGKKKRECDCYNGQTKEWDLDATNGHIMRLIGPQGLDDLSAPLRLTFEQATELNALGLPESMAKRTGLARFPTDTNWDLSAEHRVNRRKDDLSAALNDFDDSPRAASEEFDPSTALRDFDDSSRAVSEEFDPYTALTDFDDPPHNPDVAPWEARAIARVERVSERRQPSIGPAPQSVYVRSPNRRSPIDLTGVTNSMGSATIAAPVRPTIEQDNQASSARALGDISGIWSAKAPFAKFDTPEQDLPARSPGQRREDEEKTTQRRKADEERIKKRKTDEEKQKQAHAEKGSKPSGSGGHKRGKH